MVSSFDSSGGSSIRRNVNFNLEKVNNAFGKLSSGSRITRPSDDAAGLAIASALDAQQSVSAVGIRNAGDTISALSIAEGAAGQVSDILTRQGELAAQAANGTLSDDQRKSLDNEFQQLSQEVNRITQTTEFNGTKLLSGDGIDTQVGDSTVSAATPNISQVASSLVGVSISNASDAASTLDKISQLSGQVSNELSNVGASTSRLGTAIQNLDSARVNDATASSRIRDADVAKEVADLTRNQILAQSGVALDAQSKLTSANVLRLLS